MWLIIAHLTPILLEIDVKLSFSAAQRLGLTRNIIQIDAAAHYFWLDVRPTTCHTLSACSRSRSIFTKMQHRMPIGKWILLQNGLQTTFSVKSGSNYTGLKLSSFEKQASHPYFAIIWAFYRKIGPLDWPIEDWNQLISIKWGRYPLNSPRNGLPLGKLHG